MRRLALMAAFWLLLPLATLRADAIISVDPPAPSVLSGHTFSLTVDVAGVSDLYGYQFDLYFNPAILAALSVSEGSFLSAAGPTIFLPGVIANAGGTITDNADILQSAVQGVTGGGTLLTFSFQALSPGDTSVQVENLIALNAFGEGLVLNPADAVVTVSVPEPAGALLFASGLFLLGAGLLRSPAKTQR